MENYLSILANLGSQNEPTAIKALQQFCSENEKAFTFFHLDVSLRKKFIDVILGELTTKDIGLKFKIHAISVLRILSRDKDGLGSLTSEKSTFTLLSLAELLPEGIKSSRNTCSNEVGHRKSVEDIEQERADDSLERVVAASDVVIEALKCLCNVVFHSPIARQHCFKLRCIEAIITRVKKWFDNSALVSDLKYFDLRFLFLLTALENTARVEVVADNGFCVLTHALDSCIPGKEQRKICHETKVRDGCGQLTGARLHSLTVVERYVIQYRYSSSATVINCRLWLVINSLSLLNVFVFPSRKILPVIGSIDLRSGRSTEKVDRSTEKLDRFIIIGRSLQTEETNIIDFAPFRV